LRKLEPVLQSFPSQMSYCVEYNIALEDKLQLHKLTNSLPHPRFIKPNSCLLLYAWALFIPH